MFYVARVTGELSPYSTEFFQTQRELEQARLAAGRTGEITTQIESSPTSQSSTQTPPTAPVNTPLAPAVATGMAGAGASKGTKEGGSEASRGTSSSQIKEEMRHHTEEQVSSSAPSPRVRMKRKEEERPPQQGQSPPRSKPRNPYEKIDSESPDREKALLASQLMSSPVLTLEPEQKIGDVYHLFRERRFRHLPVVNQKKELVGILSDRDFLFDLPKDLFVKDKMISSVLCAHEDTEIRKIAHIMFQERIGAMPIVNPSMNLVGILTRSDILRALIHKAPLELWI